MAGLCAAPDPDLGMVRGLLGAVDCNVQVMAQAGYGAIASPSSPAAQILTLVLTIYIGVMGLRLMLGLGPLRVGELTMTALKIGVIVALATNWPTYQQLVFDVLLKAPEQLGADILKSLESATGPFAANPFQGLQAAYDDLSRAAQYYGGKSAPQTSPLLGGAGLGAMSLNLSAMLLLLNSLGALLAAKIVLAVLLAIGPVFVVLLLFESTRGLFEGWLRAALAFAFVPLLAVLGLVVQLVMLEPQLARLADMRARNLLDPGIPSGVLLLCLIFTFVTAALMLAVGVVAFGFRLPARRSAVQTAFLSGGQAAIPPTPSFAGAAMAGPAAPAQDRPERALQIARAAAALERRDIRTAAPAATFAAGGLSTPAQGRGATLEARRTAQPRRAASNQRRDR
jgi:type IV secretion system protein VirB6